LLAGERWEHRESGIKELMGEGGDEADQIEQARLTKEPACKHCRKTGLRIISKDLMYRGPDYDQKLVIIMLECPHCKKRSAVWEDDRPYESPKAYCEKCKTEMGKKTSRRNEVVTDTFLCPKCGNTFKEKLDLRITEEKPDKYWEVDKARFLLDEKRGREYIEERQHLGDLESIKTLLDSSKEHEEHKELYDAVAALKRVNIGQLQETLQAVVEKVGYTELRFEKPEMGKDVIIGFSCLDGRAERAEYDSRITLKKTVVKRLNATNWRLMSDGISYRLGYLTGRLRAYDREEDMLRLVGKDTK
jgi:transposase-like protein